MRQSLRPTSAIAPIVMALSPTTSQRWLARIRNCSGSASLGQGWSFEIGDVETGFSIQSVSKRFVFALVCEALGYETARKSLGVNSTGFPFNSLIAVELNDDRTMNPLVNAGAIATTSLVPGDTGTRSGSGYLTGFRASPAANSR